MKTKKPVEYSTQNKCACGCGKWAMKGKTYYSHEHCLNKFRNFTIKVPRKIIYNKSWA